MERRIKWSDKSKRSDNLLGPRKERRITKGATNYLGAAPRGLERECRAKLPPLRSTHTCSRSHLSLTQCNQFIRTNTVDCNALIVELSLHKKIPEDTLGLDVKDHFLNALNGRKSFFSCVGTVTYLVNTRPPHTVANTTATRRTTIDTHARVRTVGFLAGTKLGFMVAGE